jgi:hypothetical protein
MAGNIFRAARVAALFLATALAITCVVTVFTGGGTAIAALAACGAFAAVVGALTLRRAESTSRVRPVPHESARQTVRLAAPIVLFGVFTGTAAGYLIGGTTEAVIVGALALAASASGLLVAIRMKL